MHIIIPLRDFSMHNNIELRYCLRSIEKHITGYDDIYIACKSLPKWITNVKHVISSDVQRYGYTAMNIFTKIKHALDDTQDENVLLLSDDYFLTCDINTKNISYYNKGDIDASYQQRDANEPYSQTLVNTYSYLFRRMSTTHDCDLHYPIIINKEKLLSIIPDTWNVHGYSIRSLYVNLNNIPTTFMKDNKISKAKEFKPEMKFFSTTDTQIDKDMKELFERLYPNKSIYEK